MSTLGNTVLVMADLHLAERDSYGLMEDGIPLRLSDKLKILKGLVNQAIQYNVGAIVVAGDIFHEPSVSERLKALFYQCFESFSGKVILLVGNHDFAATGIYNFISDRALIDQQALSKFVLVNNERVTIDWIDFLPWLPTEKLMTWFKENEPVAKMLVSHFMVSGATNGNSKLIGIPQDLLAKYFLVALGDVHRRQRIGNWGYVGSPFRNDFGEEGYETGAVLLSNASVTGIAWSYVNTNDRQFYTIAVDINSWEQDVTKAVKDKPVGSFFKLVLRGNSAAIATVNKHKVIELAISLGAVYCTILYEDTTEISLDEDPIKIGQDRNLVKLFEGYCAGRKDADEKTIALGKKLLDAVA